MRVTASVRLRTNAADANCLEGSGPHRHTAGVVGTLQSSISAQTSPTANRGHGSRGSGQPQDVLAGAAEYCLAIISVTWIQVHPCAGYRSLSEQQAVCVSQRVLTRGQNMSRNRHGRAEP